MFNYKLVIVVAEDRPT